MSTDVILVLCNCPDSQIAEQIAREILVNQLAACINILPAVQSMYRWQGNIEQSSEITLLIKAPQQKFQRISETILRLHPYTVPEIIAVPVSQGFQPYLNWLHEECQSDD